jgi:hypothetical protein
VTIRAASTTHTGVVIQTVILLLLNFQVLQTFLGLTYIDLSTSRTLNMSIRLSNDSLGTTRESRALVLLDLDLLLHGGRRRIGEFLNLLPLLAGFKVGLNRCEKFVQGVCDCGLEDLGRQLRRVVLEDE